MLVIQDIHIVHGRDELTFQDSYRDSFGPKVADGGTVCVAGFFWAPHGGGEGYEAVVVTVADDEAALTAHQRRLATGDLAAPWAAIEGQCHEIRSTVHRLAPWSPLASRTLPAIGSPEHEPVLFCLDTIDVHDTLAAEDELSSRTQGSSVVQLEACWSPLLGPMDSSVVHVLSRVASNEALTTLLALDGTPSSWPGAPQISAERGRLTRLLRSVAWSPVP